MGIIPLKDILPRHTLNYLPTEICNKCEINSGIFLARSFSLLKSIHRIDAKTLFMLPGTPSGGQATHCNITATNGLSYVEARPTSFRKSELCRYLGVTQSTTAVEVRILFSISLARFSYGVIRDVSPGVMRAMLCCVTGRLVTCSISDQHENLEDLRFFIRLRTFDWWSQW